MAIIPKDVNELLRRTSSESVGNFVVDHMEDCNCLYILSQRPNRSSNPHLVKHVFGNSHQVETLTLRIHRAIVFEQTIRLGHIIIIK